VTSDTAGAAGLYDRGVLAVGKKADVNIIDWAKLGSGMPYVVSDLPAGGKRLLQKVTGYDATIVSGNVTFRDGEATGVLPGRLVRGPQVELIS
jgi:N-acyl-D-aspartate/D-glutamate deacylase